MTSDSAHLSPAWEEHVLRTLRDAAQIESRLDVALRPLDLTADRWRALTFVTRSPGASMAEVIEALAMPSTSATRTVDALVEVCALFRSPHPSDRRRVTLHPSVQGQRLLRSANASIEAMGVAAESPAGPDSSAITPVS